MLSYDRTMAAGKSTRLSIVEQSLEDILDRLESLPASARARELRAKARVYERAVRQWPAQPPTESSAPPCSNA